MSYNSKIKVYPNGKIKITCFNKQAYDKGKLTEIELLKRKTNKDKKNLLNEEINANYENEIKYYRSDNLKRARDNIFDISILNADIWTHMITLTLNQEKIDRYDYELVNKKIKKWLQNNSSRNELKYLIVPELHKDGAIHFHGLISAGKLNLIDTNIKDKQGRPIFNINSFNYGFSTAVPLDDNKIAVSKYITKYMTKDSIKILGNSYYAGGKGLKRETDFYYDNISLDKPYTMPNGLVINIKEIEPCKVKNTDIEVRYIVLNTEQKGEKNEL